jgi:hypothetical protein
MSRGLPRYWVRRHGAYYYRPPAKYAHLFDKGWVHLGRKLSDAYRAYAELPVHDEREVRSIADLCQKYENKVIPTYPAGTQANKYRSVVEVRKVFGHIPINRLEPTHCYQYFDAKQKTRTARAVIEDLRHMFTKAVEWGLLKRHPIKGQVVLKKTSPRSRYVTDDELFAFLEMASPKLKAYIRLKLVTGLSKQDILCLDRADLLQDGLHTMRRKVRGKPKIYPWDEKGVLHRIVESVHQAHRGHVGSTRLFHTREGKPYYNVDENGRATSKPSSFNSMWQRLMSKWVASGRERFTEHDLRAKVASDTDLSHAQALMDHANSDVTEKVYRRAPKVVLIRDGESDQE